MIGNKYSAGHKPVNAFPKGHIPWSKGKKGIHISPQSEFKKGIIVNWVPVGSESLLNDKNGKPRYFVKAREPNIWKPRAQIVWESALGVKIPPGHILHHKNRITTDDSLENLELLTRGEHIKEHRRELLIAKGVANG